MSFQVADYLGREFYKRNYNLRQRMDMLEVQEFINICRRFILFMVV